MSTTGQQVVVNNRPSGSGMIAAAALAKAPADGYALLLDATAFTVNPSLIGKWLIDAANDLASVTLVFTSRK